MLVGLLPRFSLVEMCVMKMIANIWRKNCIKTLSIVKQGVRPEMLPTGEMRINTSILYIDIVLRRHLHLTSCNFACKNTWHELSRNATISVHSDCQLKCVCLNVHTGVHKQTGWWCSSTVLPS